MPAATENLKNIKARLHKLAKQLGKLAWAPRTEYDDDDLRRQLRIASNEAERLMNAVATHLRSK